MNINNNVKFLKSVPLKKALSVWNIHKLASVALAPPAGMSAFTSVNPFVLNSGFLQILPITGLWDQQKQ